MAPKYYIGIDSGGTHTRALAALASGKIVGSAVTGSSNRNHYTRGEIRSNIGSAIALAMHDLPKSSHSKTVFIGTSGVSTEQDCNEIREIIYETSEIDSGDQIIVDNDTRVALTGGLVGRPGLALVAGTGSACYGVNENAERHLCGGWGALADDSGSGPWLGIRAVQCAVRAQDGRMPSTQLQNIVFDFLGINEPRELIRHIHDPQKNLSRSDLGALAPKVLDACRDGDATAAALVIEATEELAAMVLATSQKLFADNPCDLVLVGGLALSGYPFQTQLVETLTTRVPSVTVREPKLTPAHGAVLESLHADGIKWNDEIIGNLVAHHEKASRN